MLADVRHKVWRFAEDSESNKYDSHACFECHEAVKVVIFECWNKIFNTKFEVLRHICSMQRFAEDSDCNKYDSNACFECHEAMKSVYWGRSVRLSEPSPRALVVVGCGGGGGGGVGGLCCNTNREEGSVRRALWGGPGEEVCEEGSMRRALWEGLCEEGSVKRAYVRRALWGGLLKTNNVSTFEMGVSTKTLTVLHFCLARSPECKREHQFQPKVDNSTALLFTVLRQPPHWHLCTRPSQRKRRKKERSASFRRMVLCSTNAFNAGSWDVCILQPCPLTSLVRRDIYSLKAWVNEYFGNRPVDRVIIR